MFKGATASWSAHTKHEECPAANTFAFKFGPYKKGHPTRSSVYYQSPGEDFPRASVSFNAPQRLTLNVSPSVSAENALKLTNGLHKYLVKSVPFNSQLTGSAGNVFIEEKDSLFYQYHQDETDQISQVSLTSYNGISDELILYFQKDREVIIGEEKLTLNVSLHRNDYFIPSTSTRFTALTPCFPTGTIKPNAKSLKYTAAGGFLQSINHTINGARHAPELSQEDEWVCGRIEKAGLVKVRCYPIEAPYRATRGGRRALTEQAYQVDVITEVPILLHSIGMHRRYGCGVLEAL